MAKEIMFYGSYKDDPDLQVWEHTQESLTKESWEDGADTWVSLLEKGGFAVDYNYCINDGDIYSALYGCFADSAGDISVDADCYKHYKVDFSDLEWKEKLLQEAYQFLKDISKDY